MIILNLKLNKLLRIKSKKGMSEEQSQYLPNKAFKILFLVI